MNEVYACVYERLDRELINIPVGDHIPQDDVYPYVQVNGMNLTNNDTVVENGFTATIDVIAWSRYRGQKEVSKIVLDIYKALHRHAFADTTSYGISGIHQEFSKIITESDGLTRQGIQRFKIFFEEI